MSKFTKPQQVCFVKQVRLSNLSMKKVSRKLYLENKICQFYGKKNQQNQQTTQ